jgi:transglutaminase superfamily protein
MNARMEQTRSGRPVIFANHGALVANPQETSLRRFVNDLTRDIQPDTAGAREARVQRVLDFVSREIKYDMREATYNFELLKRPNEVLMSGESDCSNKAILLGSLLEQLGEDYLFVYTPDHITVAVKQGGSKSGGIRAARERW